MAARSLLLSLASASRAGLLNLPQRTLPRRHLHLSAANSAPSVANSTPGSGGQVFHQPPPASAVPGQTDDLNDSKHAAFLGEADSNDGLEAYRDSYGAPPPALDAKNAAFLGEADSDDAFEAQRAVEGDRHEPLDPKNAAFLGEADSDDAFEATKAVEGDKHEPLNAHNAAFLGEADSDDAFEADVELHPEKHRHKIEDTSPSGLHGQGGEQDQ
ncbi:hypothetical protein A1O3_04651 [Capronia epimyces CBS 606.96]|uniref:Uncharacterized protein n=1 Tax=Capronia epimyces CBS 606.96 TaxID=1182542 RepID=W9YNZ3_9EURO|nr:uncharacterized protein A1O3_04651 [Capronia epimyces CBS 606.96]EXJ83984.1 hypothetical protein A1O3_04651 [Capronia epimyces CBS 606.96]